MVGAARKQLRVHHPHRGRALGGRGAGSGPRTVGSRKAPPCSGSGTGPLRQMTSHAWYKRPAALPTPVHACPPAALTPCSGCCCAPGAVGANASASASSAVRNISASSRSSCSTASSTGRPMEPTACCTWRGGVWRAQGLRAGGRSCLAPGVSGVHWHRRAGRGRAAAPDSSHWKAPPPHRAAAVVLQHVSQLAQRLAPLCCMARLGHPLQQPLDLGLRSGGAATAAAIAGSACRQARCACVSDAPAAGGQRARTQALGSSSCTREWRARRSAAGMARVPARIVDQR